MQREERKKKKDTERVKRNHWSKGTRSDPWRGSESFTLAVLRCDV